MNNHLYQLFSGKRTLKKQNSHKIQGAADWSQFGIRDPSPLTYPDGANVFNDIGGYTIYFNARNKAIQSNGKTIVGSIDVSPILEPSTAPRKTLENGGYCAQGSALKLASNSYKLFFSPDTQIGFKQANSSNGKSWKIETEALLCTTQYGLNRMGLPFVRKFSEVWLMLFEGSIHGRFSIYMAISEDGERWYPANDGKTIYIPRASAWDEYAQANPSIYKELQPDGRVIYFILYNGCSEAHGWDIGLLRSYSIFGPWQPMSDPILRREKVNGLARGRIEGARYVFHPDFDPKLIYFSLPSSDSYQGGYITCAEIK